MGRTAPRHPLVELTLARILEFGREPEALFWTFVFPVLVAIALGIAFRNGPAETPRVVLTGDEEAVARVHEILRGQQGIASERAAEAEAGSALRSGRADLLLRATGGTGDRLEIVYRFDPMRPASRAARLAVDAALQRGLGRVDPARTRDEAVTEPGGRYIDFLIPGLIGLNVMGSSMWGIGYAVVLARRRRLLRRLAVTPMWRSHYLLAHMLSRITFLFVEVAVLTAFGWLAFDVAVRGSLGALAIVALLGAFSFMGIALLVAARTDNTEVASGWMNAVMLPMWLLSGAFFSYERFPAIALPLIRLLPLTAFNDALRGVVNEGLALHLLWPQLAVLGFWGMLGFVLALKVFRWQ